MKLLFNWSSKDLSSEIMIIRIAKIRREVFFKKTLVLNKSLIIHSNLQFAPQRDEEKRPKTRTAAGETSTDVAIIRKTITKRTTKSSVEV